MKRPPSVGSKIRPPLLLIVEGGRCFSFEGLWSLGAKRKLQHEIPTATTGYHFFLDNQHAALHPQDIASVEACLEDRHPKARTLPIISDDGTVRTLTLEGSFHELDHSAQSSEAEELQSTLQMLHQAEEVAEMGSWAFEPASDKMSWSDGMYRLFDLDTEYPVSPETFLHCAHPESEKVAQEVIETLRHDPRPFVHTLLIDTGIRDKRLKIKGTVMTDQRGARLRLVGIALDVSAIAESEQALRDQSHFISNILKAMPDAVNVINLQTQEIEYINRGTITHRPVAASNFTRVSIREGIQRYVHPDDLATVETYLRSFRDAEDEEVHHVEYRARNSPDGKWLWFRSYGKVFSRNAEGTPNRCVNVIQNISDAKESLAEIIRMKESMADQAQRQYEELFRSIDQGFTILELIPGKNDHCSNLRFITANPATLKILGLESDITGKMLTDLMPDPPSEWLQLIERIVSAQQERRFTLNLHPLSDCWVEAFAFPTGNPEACRVAVLFNDITERMRFEEDLRDRQLKLEIAQRAARVGIWTYNIQTHQGMGTQEWMELTGHITSETWTLEDLLSLLDGHDVAAVTEAFRNAAHDKSIDVEFRIQHPERGLQWFLMRGSYIQSETVGVDALMGTLIDITERKRFEEQQDEFLAIASHELKTPVTSIKAYADILNDFMKRQDNQQWLMVTERLSSQIDRLTRLITDLLDTTGLKSGGLTLQPNLFDLTDLVRDRVEEIQRASGRVLLYNPGSSVMVHADRDRIGQVLHNLLSNAIKYSPRDAPVVITVDANDAEACVSVRDFGAGLAPEDQERIFQRFYRSSDRQTHTVTGLGLGLYIASEIVRKHQGIIGVDSRKDEGARFYFTLPLAQTQLSETFPPPLAAR